MLKAGVARVDVTPPLGSYMSGKFNDRYAKGILDPIQLNALAVFDGKETNLSQKRVKMCYFCPKKCG